MGTAPPPIDPLAPKKPHVTPRAKSIIWCFMEGAPSHVDLFDPKPALVKYAGQPVPPSYHPETLQSAFGTTHNGLYPTRHTFKQYGESGLWVSDWLPNIAEHMDEIAVLRSCHADGVNHVGAVCQMNTGEILAGRPSMGAWVTYGLGSANQNLPTFVVMQDDKEILGGVQNYSSGFLPCHLSGHAVPQGRHADPEPEAAHWHDGCARAQQAGISAGHQRPVWPRQSKTTLNWTRARDPMSWPIACNRPRPKRWTSAPNRKPPRSCTVWTIQPHRCMEPTFCSRAV